MEHLINATLTVEQLRAIAANPSEPIRIADPETKKIYVLLCEDDFNRVKRVLDQDLQPRDTYEAIDRAFAAGWNDPKMDDYDRYEEVKR